jgi:RimJ/RimL family protein N-acetyltransferase
MTMPSCRRSGLHIVGTPRLWIVSARNDDQARAAYMMTETVAQHWLGWSDEDLAAIVPIPDGPVHDLHRVDDVVRPDPARLYFTGIDRASMRVAASITVFAQGPRYEVGGAVGLDFRGRGYGREALRAVCRLAHRHFGIRHLTAACERTNQASQRWLRSAGFSPGTGPETIVLGNGREVQPMWWVRSALLVRRACRWWPPARPWPAARPWPLSSP